MTVNLTSTDNAALAAAIRDLQAQVTTLRRSSLQLGPHQMGSVAGEASNLTLRASRILPPNFTGPYMELDLTQVPTNNTTRLSPALHVNDGTNERVQVGNLGPNGISPAQYGLRVNDASGNPIFDSLGLIAVMKLIATNTRAAAAVSGTAADQSILNVSLTLTRTQSVLLVGLVSGFTQSTGAGPFTAAANIYLQITGQPASMALAIPQWDTRPPGTPGGVTPIQVVSGLAAGSYSANVMWSALNGTVDILSLQLAGIYVFLLGG